MTSLPSNPDLSFLPDPGEGRFWRILHNPKSRTNPMTIQLHERYIRGRRGPAGIIGFEYATANKKDLKNKAEEVLERCSGYAEFVGDYDPRAEEKTS